MYSHDFNTLTAVPYVAPTPLRRSPLMRPRPPPPHSRQDQYNIQFQSSHKSMIGSFFARMSVESL